ncbi:opioid-binding protein/cell adhesion molecule-like isoform X2 [Anticarsia gemmatalis]|uniref:opioid-binding protein/cell adhesion molecule-like isoform X2 n=1 Tax=Anticarsia gemmatalis TaxID=129554 RepID=UPI003F75A11E
MELRRLALCMAFFVLAVSQCSEARHSVRRRETFDDDVNYDDNLLADEAGDEDTQNDTDNDSQPEPIKVQAVIETTPTFYEVESGADQRLECKVSPDTGTVVQWFKNNMPYFIGGINLHNEEDRYAIAPDSKDLLIKNARVSDSGVFRCETVQQSPIAINHTLLVTEKPKVVNMSSSSGGVVGEGSELTLTCVVTGSPVPTVLWSVTRKGQENERLTEKDGEFSADGNIYSLYIKSVKRDQAGKYYCYAFNKVGTHQAETEVIVQRKPQVHVTRTIVNSDLRIEAVLQCSAHEEPRPHFRWYKDGGLIEDSSSNYKIITHGSHSNLTVFPTDDADFGTFTCEAENDFGKHNRSIELVQSPVVEDLEVDGSKMSWIVHSHQPLKEMEVQLKSHSENGEWRRLTVPLPEGSRHTYEVTYLLDDKQLEAGQYEAIVKVKNSKSWGGSNEPANVNIVYRGSAHSIRPAYTVLSTILMYLLVRML